MEVEEKINISDNLEMRMVTGIPVNSRVSSSGEPSTVGADVVTTSAVSTAVQVSPPATRQPSTLAILFYISELVIVGLLCSVNGVYGLHSTAVSAVYFS